MKRWKKMLVSFLTICMLSGLSAVSVLAADGTPYTYTVTLSAGNKGVFNGAAKLTGLRTGDAVSFDISQVQVADEKYYVKGIRLSGRDNEEALAAPAFRVTGDADYVVAYGIKGNQVAYTVNYQDGSGNALAESKTFYGNVGDSPVVAYRYIENYVPQALALAGTLVENEAENVFTFVYQPGDSGTVVQTTVTTETVTVQGTPATAAGTAASGAGRGTGTAGVVGTGASGTGEAGTATANGTGTTGGTETGNAAEGTQDAAASVVEIPEEEKPQDLIRVDEEDTPTANKKLDKEDTAKGLPLAGMIAVGVVSLLAVIGVILIVKKRLS